MSLKTRALLAALLLAAGGLFAAKRARAIATPQSHKNDARRFGLDQPEPKYKPGKGKANAALVTFNKLAPAAKLQAAGVIAPAGANASILAQNLSPEAVAEAFFRSNESLLGIDFASLKLERKLAAGGITHFLYTQTHNGLPVEFARIKLHVADGEAAGLDNGWIAGITAGSAPSLTEPQAALAAAADLGASALPDNGRLVYLPVYATGETRLAWHFRVSKLKALWNYYIDAQNGAVLFRYNDLRFQACPNAGSITGTIREVYQTTDAYKVRGIPYQQVWVYNASLTTAALTDTNGFYCHPSAGKMAMSLQGPYVSVAHADGGAAHYDNGGGQWVACATPVASPHPYANGTALPNADVFTATILTPAVSACSGLAAGPVLKAMPRFSSFAVGAVSAEGDPTDDDQVHVIDAQGGILGSYMGTKSAFNGAPVHGLNPTIRLRLAANTEGQHNGFDISISSYFLIPNANSPAVTGEPSFTWTSTTTAAGVLDDVNVFFHLNQMRDYFMADINKSSAALLNTPLSAMVKLGPALANAFYNPDHGTLAFGNTGDFALDPTVVRHEYTHYVMDRIYPIVNFGQAGAISEAMADYFAGSSLGVPDIGRLVLGSFGSEGSLRHMDCVKDPVCQAFPVAWSGEIHDDSIILSQALWELRIALGQPCADQLAFQSVLFFPDSFQEYLDAMLQVDARGLAPACGPSRRTTILAKFTTIHGIDTVVAGGDGYEPNDGVQTAANLSTAPFMLATIYPAADIDTYVFGAGPGLITATVELPAGAAEGTHNAYGLLLLDKDFKIVAQAVPTLQNATFNGGCPASVLADSCLSDDASVTLSYNNPAAGEFYLQIAGAPTDEGSNSGTHSANPYKLTASFNAASALSGSVVTAAYDGDVIAYTVNVATFSRFQNFSFSHARLRDQSGGALPGTETTGGSPYLILLSSASAYGKISGQLRIAQGFAARYPSVGTVRVEVFGYNRLQQSRLDDGDAATAALAQSLGQSNPINLTASQAGLSAWNNVFNPLKGEKATFKYEVTGPGRVTLKLYTLAGHEVLTLLDEDKAAGKGSIDWAGTNVSGNHVASGVYILHLKGPGVQKTQKVVVVK